MNSPLPPDIHLKLDRSYPETYRSVNNDYRVKTCSPYPLPTRINSRDLPLPFISEVSFKGKVTYPYLRTEAETMTNEEDFRYATAPQVADSAVRDLKSSQDIGPNELFERAKANAMARRAR